MRRRQGDQRARTPRGSRAKEAHQFLRPEQPRGDEALAYAHQLSDSSDQQYNFGETEYVESKNRFKERILSELTKKGPLYLVFHDNNQDIK
jgi:hypothetical protein